MTRFSEADAVLGGGRTVGEFIIDWMWDGEREQRSLHESQVTGSVNRGNIISHKDRKASKDHM